MKKILIMGLPGAGKTTLSIELAKLLGAVHFNADEIRNEINKDLGFTEEDRVEQAKRMGILCDIVVRSGQYAIADFVCPTRETRNSFGKCFTVFVDRIKEGRFEDTNTMFQKPFTYEMPDIIVTEEGTPLYWANKIKQMLIPPFSPKIPTALFLGRYQPFHDAHKALIEEGIKRLGQVCIAIRDTQGIDDKNPFSFEEVEQNINIAMKEHTGKYTVVRMPNITNVYYGRDVGYGIEMIELSQELQDISATKIREQII